MGSWRVSGRLHALTIVVAGHLHCPPSVARSEGVRASSSRVPLVNGGAVVPYSIDSAKQVVEVTLSGRLSYESIAAMLEDLAALATAALPERLAVLIDETNASPGLLGVNEVRNWITRWKSATSLREGRIAVVAPSLVMFGLNRMAQGLARDETVGHLAVFKSRDVAMEWLLARPARSGDSPS
jgi:hypothetical protein